MSGTEVAAEEGSQVDADARVGRPRVGDTGGRWSLLPWCLSALVGGVAGYGGWYVSVVARAYCDTSFEAGQRFGLMVVLQPLLVLGGCGLGGAAWGVGRFLARRVRTVWGCLLPPTLVAVMAVLLPWAIFATVGTPAGLSGPPFLCPVSNIPPWWPRWIPA